jgi:3-dehydroquinate synthase
MATPPTQVRVDLGERGYTIHVGPGTLASLPAVITASLQPTPRRIALIADRGVPAATVTTVESDCRRASLDPLVIPLSPSEPTKSLATAQSVLTALARHRFERWDVLIALGGGIVGDLAGFVASIYRRGMPVIQCPTTLLAMVDASVGGKTGVNLAIGDQPGDLKKNMAGAFHQPAAVIADISVLASLPDRDFRCGLAECIKHGMLAADWGDPGLLDWTEAHLLAIASKSPATVAELVTRNIRVKAAVVGRDERELDESGGRMSLNLGTHLRPRSGDPSRCPSVAGNPLDGLQHGEAVALGLIASARTAAAMGLISGQYADRIAALVASASLPTSAKGVPDDDRLFALMAHDKKVSGGRLRLILPTGPGRVAVSNDPPRSAVVAGLQAIRA